MYAHSSRAKGKPAQQSIDTYPKTYIAGLIIGALLFVPSVILAHTHQLHGFQARIFYDVNNWPNMYRIPALWVTEGLGAAYPIAACVLIPLLYKRFRLAWRFFFTVGGATAVMEVAKLITKEPRPITLLHGNLHQRAIETGPGFPSGHMVAATAMALTLWMILPKAWRWVSVLWIALVAISRLYLGVHTPNDIVGGFAIGLMAVCFVRLLPIAIARPLRLDSETPLLEQGWE